MKRLVWVLAWVGVALWSLFALGAHGVLDLVWSATTAGADLAPREPGSFTTGEPHPLEDLFPFFAALKSLGGFALVAVWAVGAATMLGGTWAILRLNDALWAATAAPAERPRRSALPPRRSALPPEVTRR